MMMKSSEKVSPENRLLEVIACSFQDAIAAAAGGAHRLELISHFEAGGLTPALSLLDEVLAAVNIPVRVMLRESESFQITDATERRRLRELVQELATRPVDGIVCGFLKGDQVDHELLAAVIAAAPQQKFTFHRAFEQLTNPLAAIDELKNHPQIDRILTSGPPGNDEERAMRLELCAQAARPTMEIIAGGNLEAGFIRLLRARTSLREFHVGRIVREPATTDGTVSSHKVRQLVDELLLSADQA